MLLHSVSRHQDDPSISLVDKVFYQRSSGQCVFPVTGSQDPVNTKADKVFHGGIRIAGHIGGTVTGEYPAS